MRQVPYYLVIGSGRIASHMLHYLNLLGIPCRQWCRKAYTIEQLDQYSQDISHTLIAISDNNISNFLENHAYLYERSICLHFSGSLVCENAYAAHPLMTFTSELYNLQTYRAMAFMTHKGTPDFSELLPGLPNKTFRISADDVALYHALCVSSGNFTVLLWNNMFQQFQEKLNIPKEAALPYLQQITKNLMNENSGAFTGPFQRNDQSTIDKNYHALKDDPYQKVYKAFMDIFNITEGSNHHDKD